MDANPSPSLLRSFERHLRAQNRSERTIASYLESARQAEAFLITTAAVCSMPAGPTWKRSWASWPPEQSPPRAPGHLPARAVLGWMPNGWSREPNEAEQALQTDRRVPVTNGP